MNRDTLASSSDAPLENGSVIQLDVGAFKQVSVKTEKLTPRQRKIVASVAIPRSLEQVWQILTDYEKLADFLPNVTKSALLPCADGGIRIEQVGAQCFLNFKFCARVILEMTECFPQEIGFSMVEGDFKSFMGKWRLQPANVGEQMATVLSYELMVQPPLAMPVSLIERHLCHNLTQNLLAICDRTIEQFA